MNATAQILIAILPLVSVIAVSVLFFFYLLWEYRKARLLIERGLPVPRSRWNERLLLIGMVAFFVGIGLLAFFLLADGGGEALLGGIMPMAAGAGIIVYYLTVARARERQEQ
jgi:hypothetical protein